MTHVTALSLKENNVLKHHEIDAKAKISSGKGMTTNGSSTDGLSWKNGIGTLSGCDNLKVRYQLK